MRRTAENFQSSDLGRCWSGVATQPVHQTIPPSQDGPRALDLGVRRDTLVCICCELEVAFSQATSCPYCDAGPFHLACALNHLCQLPESQTSPLDSRGGNSDSEDSRRQNDESTEGEIFKGAIEVTESPVMSPVKNPMFLSESHVRDQFSRRQRSQVPVVSLSSVSLNLTHHEEKEVKKESKLRRTEPAVKSYSRGSASKLLDLEANEELMKQAILEFEDDKYAASNNASVQARLSWWSARSKQMGCEPYPLTVNKVNRIGALMKAGGYRSAPQYFSCLKRQHILEGHQWTDQLALAVRDALRSIMRGIGPAKSCPSFDLRDVAFIEELDPTKGGPRKPKATAVLFSHFAAREMEAALRRRSQVTIHSGRGCGVVAMYLPASKVDPAGAGVLRRQGCTCTKAPGLCPVRAAKEIFEDGSARGAQDDDPFLGTEDVTKAPSKQAMIESLRSVAKALGWQDDQCKAVTGHILRSTGAQYFARCGVEFYKIQLFCRWGSDTILRYLRDAPLDDAEDWVHASSLRQSLEEVTYQTFETLQSQGNPVRPSDVENIVHKALQSQASEVLQSIETDMSRATDILNELKTKKIEMDDHWAAELSRRFLPRFVKNVTSQKIHCVRDEFAAGCGFEWRNTKDHVLINTLEPDSDKCEKPGCTKLFSRIAEES